MIALLLLACSPLAGTSRSATSTTAKNDNGDVIEVVNFVGNGLEMWLVKTDGHPSVACFAKPLGNGGVSCLPFADIAVDY